MDQSVMIDHPHERGVCHDPVPITDQIRRLDCLRCPSARAPYIGGIGITAAIAWHNQALWTAATRSAMRSDSDADNYVRGLAKLGIVKLPGYEPPPAVDLIFDR